jgi:DMSO/TMAO reductase YedYZ molybdopterin-dependent catalytic subunit
MTKTKFRTLMIMTALALAITVFAVACGGKADSTTTTGDQSSQTTATDATGSTAADGAESGKIKVSGLVESPMTFAALDMDYMNWVTVTAEDPSGGSAKYDGVKLSEIFDFFGVKSDAKTVVVTGSDGSSTEITLADVPSKGLLAVADDDSFSLVMPGMDAKAWVKDVVSMEFK